MRVELSLKADGGLYLYEVKYLKVCGFCIFSSVR